MTNKQRDLIFEACLNNWGLPEPEKEFKFHPKRKFRFDYAYPDKKLAIEIEGGIFTHGAHGSIAGILRDIEKYNLAAIEGWRVFRVPNSEVKSSEIYDKIKEFYQRN